MFSDTSRFCGVCGAPLTGPGLYVEDIPEKETFLAIILSVIVAGLGQIYCGRLVRGIAIMAISYIPGIIVFAMLWSSGETMSYDEFSGMMGAVILVSIFDFAVWVWQIYDAYKLSEKWNNEALRTHTRPW